MGGQLTNRSKATVLGVTTNDNWRRYLEAGTAVGQVTLARAEGIARGLLAAGGDERESAWHELDELTRFGRLMGEQLVDVARAEMLKQLETLGVGSLDQFLERIGDLVGSQSVDAPSHPAESPRVPEHPERAAGAGASGTARTENAPTHGKSKEAEAKKKDKKDKKGPKGLKGSKGKKKAKKKETKEKVPQRPHWASVVRTLSGPPDFAGSV